MTPTTRQAARDAAPPLDSDALPAADPIDALGEDLLAHCLAFVDAPTLLACTAVSRGWRGAAGRPNLWRALCEASWEGSVYTPAAQRHELTWKQRWLFAQADAARATISADELTHFVWRFHFKRIAGDFWLGIDPFWTGEGPQLRRVFHPDGTTGPAGPADPLAEMFGAQEMRWRFCKTKEGRCGHFVKVNQYPSLEISRTPDGGWRMHNYWVVYEACLEAGGEYAQGIPPSAPRHRC